VRIHPLASLAFGAWCVSASPFMQCYAHSCQHQLLPISLLESPVLFLYTLLGCSSGFRGGGFADKLDDFLCGLFFTLTLSLLMSLLVFLFTLWQGWQRTALEAEYQLWKVVSTSSSRYFWFFYFYEECQ
jgi:hypothetical protein